MVAQRRSAMEVTCPHCGHRFAVDDTIAEHLEEEFRKRALASLRKEVIAEVDQRAELKARKLSVAEVRREQEKTREAERRNKNLQAQITKLQKKMPEVRAQELGIERQRTLLELLHDRFPTDRFTEVKRGASGADVVQEVGDDSGPASGTILWESKRAATWQTAWIRKLAMDQKKGSHSMAAIVSEVLSDDSKVLIHEGAIWACKLDVVGELAGILRQNIIMVTNARGAAARCGDLKGRVYDYLVSADFADRIVSVVTTAHKMKEGIDRERRAYPRIWAEREVQADVIVEDLAAIVGQLQGIGATLTKMEVLELESEQKALPPARSTKTTRRATRK